MEGLHDIRPPVMVGLDPAWLTPVWTAAFIVLAVIAVWLVLRKWKNRWKTANRPSALAYTRISPYETAMAALDELEQELARSADMKQLYFALGDVMKTYIGKIHGIGAREMTTQELCASMRKIDMDRALASEVMRFQEESDPFRYAPENADLCDMIFEDAQTARKLIQAMETDWHKRMEHADDEVAQRLNSSEEMG